MGQLWRYYWLIPAYLASSSLSLVFASARNLEYEYSLITGALLMVIVPLVGLFLPMRDVPHIEKKYIPLSSFDTLWTLLIAPWVLLIPAAIVFGSGLCDCSRNGYLFWMVVGVGPSWLFAHGVMHGVFWARIRGYSRRRIALVVFGSYASLACVLVSTIWFLPQKRATSLLLGFLHGPIYDRWIPVDHGIAMMRLVHAMLGATLLVVFRSWTRFSKVMWGAAFGLMVLGGYLITSEYASVRHGTKALNELLPDTLSDNGVTLHYRKKLSVSATPKHVRRIFAESLFHVKDLREKLGGGSENIHIYLYPNRQSKKLWFGAGSTDVTDVFTPSIHISYDQFPHSTLRHELVHAVTADFAFFGLGFHPNMAFTEGIAVALAPEEREITFDDSVAGMFHDKKLPYVNSLLSPFFWGAAGPRAYSVAGSLLKYIEKKHGMKSVVKLYSGSGWKSSVGRKRGQVLKAWGQHVLKGYDKEKHQLLIEEKFRSEGVLSDACPHSKQDLARSRSESVYVRLRQPINWRPESDYYRWRIKLDPKDRRSRFFNWVREIKKIAQERSTSKGRFHTWAKAIRAAKNWPPKTLEDIRMSILEADLYILVADVNRSLRVLQKIHDFAREKNIGNALMRQVEARTTIAATLPPGEMIKWWKYLAGWASIPNYNASDEGWLLSYLRVRRGDKSIAFPQVLKRFLQLEPQAGFSQSFYVEWYKHLGHQLNRVGAHAEAASSYQRARKLAPKSAKDFYRLMARQARYFSGLDDNLHF